MSRKPTTRSDRLAMERYLKNTLKEQHRQIAELKKQLKEKDKELAELKENTKTISSTAYYYLAKEIEIDKLKAKLHTQPREIVEKIRNKCCIEDKADDGTFVLDINEKDFDEILKEYGGE